MNILEKEATCQHGVEVLDDCKECKKIPHCQRVYSDTGKNFCSYNNSYGWNGRCVYCGKLPPKKSQQKIGRGM